MIIHFHRDGEAPVIFDENFHEKQVIIKLSMENSFCDGRLEETVSEPPAWNLSFVATVISTAVLSCSDSQRQSH